MHSYNTGSDTAVDALIERAVRLSHYAARQLAAEPQLRFEIPLERPFAREEMRAALTAGPPGDKSGLMRALRQLRKRVMLNLIARDLGGVAALAEVMETT